MKHIKTKIPVYFAGLFVFTSASHLAASAALPPEFWVIKNAEKINYGGIRDIYKHQPSVEAEGDSMRSPYSQVRPVSMLTLFGAPSTYDESWIGVIGYLSKTSSKDGKVTLEIYPTHEAFELKYPRESLIISPNPHFRAIEKFATGNRIEAIGFFKRIHASTKEQAVGLLEDASIKIVKPYSKQGKNPNIKSNCR